jgi:hypothetical protein
VLQDYYWPARWTWKGAGRKSMALSLGQRTDFDNFEPDLDAHLHGVAGHSAHPGEYDGDRTDLGGEFFFRRPVGISTAAGVACLNQLSS